MTDFVLRHGWPLLASVAVKSLFVPGAGRWRRVGPAPCVRRRPRHLVWSLTLLGLLLLPAVLLSPARHLAGAAWLPRPPGAPGRADLDAYSPDPLDSEGENRPPAPNSGGAGQGGQPHSRLRPYSDSPRIGGRGAIHSLASLGLWRLAGRGRADPVAVPDRAGRGAAADATQCLRSPSARSRN